MKNKIIESTNYLVRGIITLIIGILFVVGKKVAYINLLNVIVVLVFINILFEFVKLFSAKQTNQQKLVSVSLMMLGLVYIFLMIFTKDLKMAILPIIFAVYTTINGMIKFISFVLLLKVDSIGYLKEFVISTVFIVIGVSCLIAPIVNLNNILVFIGIYLIIIGTNDIMDYNLQRLPKKYRNMLKRRIRIPLPVFLEAFAPIRMLNKINKKLEGNIDKGVISSKELNKNEEPDLEIFIHVTPTGFGQVGHVDIFFDGEVLAYGNYDSSSSTFFNLIGDGVFFTTSKERYIEFCNIFVNKTLFSFGLRLTENQKNKVREQINKIKENTYRWNPPLRKESMKHKYINIDEFTDYASNLYKFAEVDYFKFKKGRFKKYFSLGTNCVLLADTIVGSVGSRIIEISGIITPGTYYSYLNREYEREGSIVISRKVYKK